ncbi:kinase-like domain-containing protein [Aspergillus californicus]
MSADSTPTSIGPFEVLEWPNQPGATGHAQHSATHEQVFIKQEWFQPLAHEALTLQAAAGGIGIPALHWLENINDKDVVLMEPYGLTLEETFHQSGRYFGMQIILNFASQLLSRVQFIHSRNIVHGNLSPWSFALGVGWQNQQLILVDFHTESKGKGAINDLQAIIKIIAYLYDGAECWEDYQIGSAPPFITSFQQVLSSKSNVIDYESLHGILLNMRRGLVEHLAIALDLTGPRAIQDGSSPNLGALSLLKTSEIFNCLNVALRDTGEVVTSQSALPSTLVQLFEDILDMYLVLLVRDRPSVKKQTYQLGAYHLPHRLWRDIRWILETTTDNTLYLALNAQAYRLMSALYEIRTNDQLFWVECLLSLSRARKSVEPDCGKAAWIQTSFYWQGVMNKLMANQNLQAGLGK